MWLLPRQLKQGVKSLPGCCYAHSHDGSFASAGKIKSTHCCGNVKSIIGRWSVRCLKVATFFASYLLLNIAIRLVVVIFDKIELPFFSLTNSALLFFEASKRYDRSFIDVCTHQFIPLHKTMLDLLISQKNATERMKSWLHFHLRQLCQGLEKIIFVHSFFHSNLL